MTGPLGLGGALLQPWCGSESELPTAAADWPRVFWLHGSQMRTRPALMREWARSAAFPAHFGGTWDALRDSLSDLSEGATFLVLEADQLLQDASPGDFRVLVQVLRQVQADLSPKPFQIVLQAEPDRFEEMMEGLRALGLN